MVHLNQPSVNATIVPVAVPEAKTPVSKLNVPVLPSALIRHEELTLFLAQKEIVWVPLLTSTPNNLTNELLVANSIKVESSAANGND